jgi:long-chain acyl-CoA synthetase
MNIATVLDMAVEAFGVRTALVCGQRRLSYGELRERALAGAAAVHESGARYLALLDENGPAAVAAVFAAAYAGVPYVALNYRLTAEELNELLTRVAPAYLVAGREHLAHVAASAQGQAVSSEEFLRLNAPDAPLPLAEDPRAIAVQLFTSGTTGKPKAAILRHEHLMSYIVGTVEFGAAAEHEAIVVSVPPYHIAGISAVLSSTYAGRRMVQLERFDPALWLEAARRERASNAFLVPTMLARLVEYLQTSGASAPPSLRAIAYGGGKMPLPVIEKAMRLFPGVDFTNAYGLTETSSTIAVLGPEDHRAAAASADPRIRRRLASVGRATSAVEIEVRNEAGQRLAPEQSGLVWVRGPQVAGEYQTLGAQCGADGWFCTRDRGFLDADGYLFLEGRADDVIVRGGENISPGEIEAVLLDYPAVADAAVVAMPDEHWGEAVAAAVVLKPGCRAGVDELQAWVKARLRSSRVPQKIVFKDQLPYNETGKLLRRLIRAEFAAAADA